MTKKILKTAILGLGRGAFKHHLPPMKNHPGFQLVAVVDPLKERCQEVVADYHCNAYDDLGTLLEQHTDLDLIVVASPTPFHEAQTLQAFAAGVDVFCDKPVTLDLAGTDRMIAAMQTHRRKFMVYQPHRATPLFTILREIIAQDLIGSIYMIKRNLVSYVRRCDWQAMSSNGGGMLFNYGAHVVDQLLALTNSTAKNVHCKLRTIASLGDADDVVKAVIETENNVILDIDINMAINYALPEYIVVGQNGTIAYNNAKNSFDVSWFNPGELQTIALDPQYAAKDRKYSSGETIPWRNKSVPILPEKALDYYQACYDYYALNQPPLVPIGETREVMRTLELCRQAPTSSTI